MIPKTIHYCWFGGKPLPELAQRCIKSWEQLCSDYKIIRWDESNFNLNSCDYIKEAYEAEKWAFVSDYARLKIIYENGGIYLDTDVELIHSLDALLSEQCFLAEETSGFVNTGLGFGAEKENKIIKEMLYEYTGLHFKISDGIYDQLPCPKRNTAPLIKYGYKFSGKEIWRSNGVTIFPPEYFCPQNYETGEMNITSNTYSIHHYSATWNSKLDNIIMSIERCKGGKNSSEYKLRKVISFPFRVINKLDKVGVKNTIKFSWEKLIKNRVD